MVYTVTLNPSIDVTLWTDDLDRDAVNHVLDERREAGGKGINVSRVLRSFGVDNVCVALAGEENFSEFTEFLQRAQLRFELMQVGGAVRENLTIRFADQTVKVNRRGQPLSLIFISTLMTYLETHIHTGDIVVFAGSLPDNLRVQDFLELMLSAKNAGAKVVVDSDRLTVADYERVRPWLIKPNIHELQHIVGKTLADRTTIDDAVATLRAAGVENVLLTLGGDGMLLYHQEGVMHAAAPRIEVKSTVGAGDSALAGFIVATEKGKNTADCVRLACACGTACAMQDGTGVATAQTAEMLYDKIEIKG